MAVFRARFAGKCNKCNAAVNPGDFISWSKRQRGVVYHASCLGDTQDNTSQGQGGEQSQGAQGESNMQSDAGQDTQSNEQAQSNMTSMQATDVENIARRVAREEDASMLASVMHGVQDLLDKANPRDLHVNLIDADGKRKVEVKNAHHTLPQLVYLISKRRHAYLYGPPGSGKSTGAVQAAKALGMRYGYVSLNPQTPESRLLGFIDAGGVYRETEFYRCYVNGGVFCIDELDNGHPALLNTLNGMLEVDSDGIGRGAFPCGVVERHADFVCVATGNTNGRGGDKLFPERRALDAAFCERFAFLAWGYDTAMEKAVTFAINKAQAKDWLGFVRSVRAFVEKQSIRMWASPRASFVGADLLRDSGWTVEAIADAVLFKGLDVDTRNRILDACPLPLIAAAKVNATQPAADSEDI